LTANHSSYRLIFKEILENHLLLVVLLIYCGGLSILAPNFLSTENILNILRQGSIIGIIAIGTTFVIIGSGFDISVGSILALSGTMVIGLQYSMPWSLACLVVLLVGALIGFCNGALSVKIGIPSIITTLATMTILRGVVYLYTEGYPFTLVQGATPGFTFLGQGHLGPIPFPVIALFILVFLAHWVLKMTRHGRYIYATGGNKEAARYSGIPVDFYQILTFVIGGTLAAAAGIIYASRLLSVSPLAGQGYEMDAIAAVVIGGTSVSGGQGSVVKTLIGVILLTVITNTFNLLSIQVYAQYVIKGVIILTAVGLDVYTKRSG
jgi:ribose transport system permease protein